VPSDPSSRQAARDYEAFIASVLLAQRKRRRFAREDAGPPRITRYEPAPVAPDGAAPPDGGAELTLRRPPSS
jgi:hypothetical protein